MLKCKNCNKEIKEKSDYCPHCGNKLMLFSEQVSSSDMKELSKIKTAYCVGFSVFCILLSSVFMIVHYMNDKRMEDDYNEWKQESYERSQARNDRMEKNQKEDNVSEKEIVEQYEEPDVLVDKDVIVHDNDDEFETTAKEILESRISREDWYDNGVFSTFFALRFTEENVWEYDGTISAEFRENPYEYDGYDIYIIDGDTDVVYLVPYSQYAPTPCVYEWKVVDNTITLVFSDGELQQNVNTNTESGAEQIEYSSYIGTWWDTDSQRCYMTIEKYGVNMYAIEAHWSSSASEDTIWSMLGSYDEAEGIIIYEGGSCYDAIYSDSGQLSTNNHYTDGSGKIYIIDGALYWDDNEEQIRNGCVFEKGM